jgi:23S rRNA (guanosine2251-2'-O)-methyltransferase
MPRTRCPDPDCATIFSVEASRLGRSARCPACGIGLTARPLAIEQQLRDQESRVQGSAGADLRRLPLAVLVDNVRSLWNVGAIFRTADACGVQRMVLCGITGTPPRPEITKTALGAEDAVAWSYRADPMAALADLQQEGYVPVAIESTPIAIPLARFSWPDRICLVIGNEVAGVSPGLLAACSHHTGIPMLGVKDSLNVAVAFGIAAHAAATALSPRSGDHLRPPSA